MSAIQVLEPVRELAPRASVKGRLSAVPKAAPARVSRFPFILGLVILVALGMGGLVVVNTQIQTQATELAALQQQATNLGHKQAQVEAEVNQLGSAANLQAEAHRLGLRPNPNPAFIVLPDGKILGTPTEVTGQELGDQVYLTWDQVVRQQEQARLQVVRDAQAKAEADRLAAAEKAAADAKAAEDKKKAAEAAKKQQASQSPAPSTQPSTTP